MDYKILVSMISDVNMIVEGEGQVSFESPPSLLRPRITFKQITSGLLDALKRIHKGSDSFQFLIGKVMKTDGMSGIAILRHYLLKLGHNAMLHYDLIIGDIPFVSIEPLTIHFKYNENKVKKESYFVLSKFAYSRSVRGEMILNSPLSYAKVKLQHSGAMVAVHKLTQPCTPAQLSATVAELDEGSSLVFMNFLANAGALQSSDKDGFLPEDEDSSLAQWAFHDLLFHANNRLGRHGDPYGGTFPFKGKFSPLPIVKKHVSSEIIPLYKPDIDKLNAEDISFSSVMEMRQSIREYGDEPIHIDQLGEFLYRTARIKKKITDGSEAGVSWRPSPGGGAIHGIEVYSVVNKCRGLPVGLYHYNPSEHYISKITNAPDNLVRTLLEMGRITGKLEDYAPNVLFVFTVRFQLVQMKYQSVAYSIILKDVGCLMQTMYLVATAMGLSPCALGGGDSDLFAATAGLNYYEETSVGEFLLGSGPLTRPEPLEIPKSKSNQEGIEQQCP